MENKLILFMILLLFLLTSTHAQLQSMSHSILTNKKDTVYFQGSGTGLDTATITLRARGGDPLRTASLNILLVCDFSSSMWEMDIDNIDRKSNHMKNAVRRFIDNELKDGDSLAIMRFAFNYQMIPEKEREYYKQRADWPWIDRAPSGALLPADSTLADSTYWIPASLRGPDGLRGHVDSIVFPEPGNDCGNYTPWAMICQNSYGIERLWWTFGHKVSVGNPQMGLAGYKTLPGTPPATLDTLLVDDAFNPKFGDCMVMERRIMYDPYNPWSGNTSTSTYYALWQAIRYATTHSSGTTPVIIFLTDGEDQASIERFKIHDGIGNGGWGDGQSIGQIPLPSYFKNFPSNANADTMQTRFRKFINDSIKNAVSLYTIILDSAKKPDYGTLFAISTYGITDTNIQKKHWAKARGSDLDSIYASIGKSIRQMVARPVSNSPLFSEFINTQGGIHYVPNSLTAGPSNTLKTTSIQIDSGSGNTIINFMVDPITGGMYQPDVFEYQYKITAFIQPNINVQSIIVNNKSTGPDSALSRAYFINSNGSTLNQYFNWNTVYVLSRVEDLVFSTKNNEVDTTGISSGRALAYSRGVNAYDTSLTLYPLIRIKASYPGYSLINVNANFRFEPFAWIEPSGPSSRTISNSGTSIKPYVVVTFDSTGSHNTTYNLMATYEKDTVQLSYRGIGGNSDYIDSIAIAIDRIDNRDNLFELRGPLNLIANKQQIVLYAQGRSHNTGNFSPINANWSINGTGFNSFYTGIRSIVTSTTDTVPSLTLPIEIDDGALKNQSDSGEITIRYNYTIGNVNYSKSFTLSIVIEDQTPISIPNAVSMFTDNMFTVNRLSPDTLESLYVNYFDNLVRIIKPPNDTIASFYSLLFYRSGQTAKYLGLDSLSDWSMNWPAQSVSIKDIDKNLFTYTNKFYPRIDSVTVTSSIGASRTLAIEWSAGIQRRLTIEAARGREGDNVNSTGTPPSPLQDVVLNAEISSDTVYAVTRDEYGNFIGFDPSVVSWTKPETPNIQFSGTNPLIITKKQNANTGYRLIATIPAGSVLNGVTLTSDRKDTVEIKMNSTGYDSMMVRVAQGTVRDTAGFSFNYLTDLPNSRVAQCRANAPEDSLPHFEAWVHNKDTTFVFPSLAWMRISNAAWTYTNKAPFAPADTGAPAGTAVPVKVIRPKYAVSRDTLVASWAYAGLTYRDTVQFRVLAGYPTHVIVTPIPSLIAGEPVTFKITLLDANDSVVTDPSLFPTSLRIYSSDPTLAFKGDTAWYNNFSPTIGTNINIKFINGVSTDSLLAVKTGTIIDTIKITLPGGGEVIVAQTIVVEAGAPNRIQIVRFNGKDTLDCASDKLLTVPITGERTQELYVALIRDANNNIITRGNTLSSVIWSATGSLSTSSDNFQPSQNTITYVASNIETSESGTIIAKVSGLVDSMSLSIVAPVRVVKILTHEWIPGKDTAKSLSIDYVVTNVLSHSLTGLDSTGKLSILQDSGYNAYLDGKLDYLDIELSTPIKLSYNMISEVKSTQGANAENPATIWKGGFTDDFGNVIANAHFYSLLPCDGKTDSPSDSTHSRYRLWLKPSFLFKQNPGCLETGFLPVITIDNKEVKHRNANGLSFGIADEVTTAENIVVDSAAPVISKVLFNDNSCKGTLEKNFVEVYFSEPVKQFSAINSILRDHRQIKAFVKRHAMSNTSADSLFMADVTVVDSFNEITLSELGESDPRESWNYSPNNGFMMYCRIVLSDSSRSIAELSSGGIEMRLSVFNQAQNLTVFDNAMNCGNTSPNRWVSIKSAKPALQSICQVFQISNVNIYNTRDYIWDPQTNSPLFAWWGVIVKDPFIGVTDTNAIKGKNFVLSVYVFDLIGNLVASPDHNPCLSVSIPYDELLNIGGTRVPTRNLDFNYLVTKTGSNNTKSPCGILPAWNALNNKGRLVAPGGYIVNLVMDNQVQPAETRSLKLILTNKKK